MYTIIDSHEDLANNILKYGRDYRRSAEETRRIEIGTKAESETGKATLGWPDYQRGQVAVVFGTLYIHPDRKMVNGKEVLLYEDFDKARREYHEQIDVYESMSAQNPQMFAMVRNQKELAEVLAPWDKTPADYPNVTHPTGLVILMEGAEGIKEPEMLEEWVKRGVHMVGPVWAGTKYAGGTFVHGPVTDEGKRLLKVMSQLKVALDVSHMTDLSIMQALDMFDGVLMASHINSRELLKGIEGERHLTDHAMKRMLERDAVIGVVGYNQFLKVDWKPGDNRHDVTLGTLIDHIDHICQMAGDANHAAIGTDFDGGYGWPEIPEEINTIADFQKMPDLLAKRGYSSDDIAGIMGANWRRHLGKILPAK
jgi:membrane dipeptidase